MTVVKKYEPYIYILGTLYHLGNAELNGLMWQLSVNLSIDKKRLVSVELVYVACADGRAEQAEQRPQEQRGFHVTLFAFASYVETRQNGRRCGRSTPDQRSR